MNKKNIWMIISIIIVIILGILVFNYFNKNNEENLVENKDLVQNQNNVEENSQIEGLTLEDYEFEMLTPDFCYNECGNGICDMLQCVDYNCTCEETIQNCAIDCK
jgi:heme/copper-type cytochrome/quinol oxidase subunit 2